jgi:hypothetical protein
LRPPDRFVAAAIDDLQFGDLLFQQLQRPPLATTLAVRNRPRRSIWLRRLRQRCAFWPKADECLRTGTASNPSSIGCWRVRAIVSTPILRAAAIWQSLHPSPASEASAFNGLGALVSCRAGYCMALHGNLFRGHKSSPSLRSHQLGSRTVSDWRCWPGDHGCLGGRGTNSRCCAEPTIRGKLDFTTQ